MVRISILAIVLQVALAAAPPSAGGEGFLLPTEGDPAGAHIRRSPPDRVRAGVIFFVSTTGDDSSSTGDLANPFRTLTRARDAVRALKSAGSLPIGGVVIYLRGGVYGGALDGSPTLKLEAQDSGTATAPVVWRAHPGEDVLLSGGISIPNAAFAPRQGHAGVLQANLTALGLPELGAITETLTPREGGPPNGSLPVPRPELFYKGQPMVLARWPNLNEQGQPEWAFTHGKYPLNCGPATTPCTGFLFDSNASSAQTPIVPNLTGWEAEARERNPWLHGYFQWDFGDGFTSMRGVSDTRTGDQSGLVGVSVGNAVGTAFQNDPSKPGARFAALNVLSELDAEGEYYIERSSGSLEAQQARGMLYFKPPSTPLPQRPIDGAFVSSAPAVIALANQTAHIAFENIRIEHSTGSAIQGPGPAVPGSAQASTHWPFPGNSFVESVHFRGCTIGNTGGGAVEIHNCRGCSISDGEISGVAGTGVILAGGLHRSLLPGANLVARNSIHHFARWHRTYNPGIFFAGAGNHFVGNEIYAAPHQAIFGGGNFALCGICHYLPKPPECDAAHDMSLDTHDAVCGSNDNVFEENFIHDTTWEVVDSGCVYSNGQEGTGYTNRGNVFKGNTIQNIALDKERLALNARGKIANIAKSFGNQVVASIYLDDTMSSWTVENNTIVDTDYAVLLHGGRDNIIRRNSFISARFGIFLAPDGIPSKGFNHIQLSVATRAFQEIRTSAEWPAWAKYGVVAPTGFQGYLRTVYLVQNNSVVDNSYCNMHPGPFCVSYDVRRCLTDQMNWTTFDNKKNGCCCDSPQASAFACPADAKRCPNATVLPVGLR